MKIYIVIGDNLERYEDRRWWNDAVFTSREAAEEYIQEQPARFARDQARIDELGELMDIRPWTDEEKQEQAELMARWCRTWGCPGYRIEEFEVMN